MRGTSRGAGWSSSTARCNSAHVPFPPPAGEGWDGGAGSSTARCNSAHLSPFPHLRGKAGMGGHNPTATEQQPASRDHHNGFATRSVNDENITLKLTLIRSSS